MEAAIKLMKMSESERGSRGEGQRPTQAPLGALQTSKYVKTGRRIVRILTSLSIAFSFRSRTGRGPSPAWSSRDALRLTAVSARYVACLLLFSPPSCFLFVSPFYSECFALVYRASVPFFNSTPILTVMTIVIQVSLFRFIVFSWICLVLLIFGIPDPSRPIHRMSRLQREIFESVYFSGMKPITFKILKNVTYNWTPIFFIKLTPQENVFFLFL